jgi:hypothetical protein
MNIRLTFTGKLTVAVLTVLLGLGWTMRGFLLTPAHAQGADATLELIPSVTSADQGGEFTVDIKLKNPSAEKVISVRSWLEYNSSLLEAVSIDATGSPFTLAAPGEDSVSVGEGRVKIGRSNISGGMTDSEAKVVTVKFRVLAAQKGTATIGFYDYQVSELGHTSVNIIDEGFPLNILNTKPASISISLNPNAVPAQPAPQSTPATQPDTTIPVYNGGIGGSGLIRPADLRANTGNGYIDLRWNAEYDPARTGYNIYYGRTSGQYTRRRTVGNVNNYRLEGLLNNEVYYLAVTAYDITNTESDYSNEVGIIVGQPLSSTAPFGSFVDNLLARVPSSPQNGPLVGWLAVFAVGTGAAVTFRPGRWKVNKIVK